MAADLMATDSQNVQVSQRQFLVERFFYPESPWNEKQSAFSASLADLSPQSTGQEGRWHASDDAERGTGQPLQEDVSPTVTQEEMERRVEEAGRQAETAGYARGMEAGLVTGRSEVQPQIQAERERLLAQGASLIESLDAARAGYFRQVEQATARLALSIAARVLRRELQMDPLLLTGAVRVALGQLAASTSVRLKVPECDREMWTEALSLIPRLNPRPQVIGDETLEPGQCQMETELGSVDLGLWPQLREIERGIFDEGATPVVDSLLRSSEEVAQ